MQSSWLLSLVLQLELELRALVAVNSVSINPHIGFALHTLIYDQPTSFNPIDVNGPCEISNSTSAANATNLPPRFVRLSCYKNVPLEETVKAKEQCLGAFEAANPACVVRIVGSGNSKFGCDVYFVSSFASKECRRAYQRTEATKLSCVLYQTLGLDTWSNRKTSALHANNYEC